MSLMAGRTRAQSKELYRAVGLDKDREAMRRLCREDLFYLLAFACNRPDADNDWVYARCREVEADRDGNIDLWSREHYKSSVITFALSIQEILRDPETTIGLFSHTKTIARAFLKQIKRELESNEFLKALFPEILFDKPEKESPQWSVDAGIVVKRSGNPKEATIEAWGLVDGQPTSKHFKILLYDDVVTEKSVTSDEMLAKTLESFELSLSLGVDPAKGGRRRIVGTRYHANDAYHFILKRGTAKPRIYPATNNGQPDGAPVFLSPKSWELVLRDRSPYVVSCQYLMDPVAINTMGFREEWFVQRTFKADSTWNRYLICDPANAKKKKSDYSVFWVVGTAPDGNYYILEAIRDRLNLNERASTLIRLHRKWNPTKTGYEQYGMQADIQHIKYVQDQQNYRFHIVELGGQVAKFDRIQTLVPPFKNGRVIFPPQLIFVDAEGKARDFVSEFLEDEFKVFPVASHDDMLDSLARTQDPALGVKFPMFEAFASAVGGPPSRCNSEYEVL